MLGGLHAGVAELADALDLGSSAERRRGSSPLSRTKIWVSTQETNPISRGRRCVSAPCHVPLRSVLGEDVHQATQPSDIAPDEVLTVGRVH